MSENIEIGKIGENEAVDYLIDKGYEILHQNWIFQHKEIDIIAEKDNTLVFCEVKTRSTNAFQEPKQAVTYKKRKNIIMAAEAYIVAKQSDKDVRFDIVSVVKKNNRVEIEHIPNAFHPLTA